MTTPAAEPDFDALFAEMAPRVLSLARRLTGDAELAQDVLQETFLAVYRALPGFRGESKIETWVYQIAMHTARRHAKRARSQQRRDVAHGVSRQSDGVPGDLNEVEALERAIAALPDAQREVICLLSLREVRGRVAAEILGIAEGTLYSRAFAARASLRTMLEDKTRCDPTSQNHSPARASSGDQ